MENHMHLLKLLDFTPAEIQEFLDTAADLKAKKTNSFTMFSSWMSEYKSA